MTDFTSTNRSGPPMSGRFANGDTFTDSLGNVFEYQKLGRVQGRWAATPKAARQRTSNLVGAVAGSGVSLTEYGAGGIHQTSFVITAMPLTILNAVAINQASGLKIYDFPEGRLLILGATGTIAETTTSALAGSLTTAKSCRWGVGTTIGVNATLATTEQDLIPVTAITSSATINVAGAASSAALAASAQFDGTATAKDAYLNFSVPTDGDLAGDATITLTGTINITWVLLGDY